MTELRSLEALRGAGLRDARLEELTGAVAARIAQVSA